MIYMGKKTSFVQSRIVSVKILKPRVCTQVHATSSRITVKFFMVYVVMYVQ